MPQEPAQICGNDTMNNMPQEPTQSSKSGTQNTVPQEPAPNPANATSQPGLQDRKAWKKAIDKEMNILCKSNIWSIQPLPEDKTKTKGQWVHTLKQYKTSGFDYKETSNQIKRTQLAPNTDHFPQGTRLYNWCQTPLSILKRGPFRQISQHFFSELMITFSVAEMTT
ncbi:hypothetical protein EB796_008495 [Bugula neritina]|uniref:Uncharacterized protein n=1 Tax=Bugula neritina TaxID=10212 RepID=A0A7J7K4Q8_BUGNE|nr:hypothetical protein EB796_008495 [Bugula neritina]